MGRRLPPLILCALLAAPAGCLTVERLARMPSSALRETPPPGLERALAVGEKAPPLSLPSTQGNVWSLEERAAGELVALVFYRGDW